MDLQRERFLNLRTAPARLNAEEAAWYLGFAAHDIPVLVSKGLLKPLGHPTQNAVKYFALGALDELRKDAKWLARATDAVTSHWHEKNLKRKFKCEQSEATEIYNDAETGAPVDSLV